MAGVAIIASQGSSPGSPGSSFNFGDILMFVACVFYAYYALAPALSSGGLLDRLSRRRGAGRARHLDPAVRLGGLAHRLRLPSLQGLCGGALCVAGRRVPLAGVFIRGVQLIGPGRAGVFVNLVPVFGAFMAVGLLGEPLATYHLSPWRW